MIRLFSDHTIETAINPIVAKFKCNECSYRTKYEEFLKRHLEFHKKAKNKNKRNNQKEATDQDSSQKVDPEAEGIDEPEEPLLQCSQCHYMARKKRSLINHIGVKHNR